MRDWFALFYLRSNEISMNFIDLKEEMNQNICSLRLLSI